MNSALHNFDRRHRSFWYGREMVFLLVITFLVANAWSVLVVGHGLTVSENFKFFLDWGVYVLAGVIQIGVAAGTLYLPDMWRAASWLKRMTLIPALWSIIFACIAFECGHQVLAQVKAGQGAELANEHIRGLDVLRERINTWAGQVPAIYKSKTDELQAHADRAGAGLDGTGVALKGPNYRQRQSAFDSSRTKFSDLGLALPPLVAKEDFRTALAEIQTRASMLESQAKRLNDFFQAVDKSSAPSNMTSELAVIAAEVASKTAAYKAFNDVSPRSLTINETFTLPGKVWRGEFFPLYYWLGIAYGFAPFLIGFLLSSVLRHVDQQNQQAETVAELENTLQEELRLGELHRQIAEARSKSFGSRLLAGAAFNVHGTNDFLRKASNDSEGSVARRDAA